MPILYNNPTIMKKQLLSAITGMAMIVCILPSCGKDETPPAPKTKTELITSSPWVFLSANASGIGDISNNPLLTCFKDNTITFATNATYTVTEGTVVCAPTTAGTFAWNFQNSEAELVLAAPLFPGGAGTFNLVSLTETNLVVSQNVTIPPSPTPILVTFTFKH